ncbi:MAG: alternative ribosome rescue aminoacyl-tRNA hydrolase ArfB [Cyclobacteriaceae bacterium]
MTEITSESKRPSISSIAHELQYFTARSSGPGGQHVNKVESKIMIKWNVRDSEAISKEQKMILLTTYPNKITKNGELIVTSENKRSQLRNKEFALQKLEKLLAKAFTRKKKRIPTKPSKAAKHKRLDNKKKHGEKKGMRKKVDY